MTKGNIDFCILSMKDVIKIILFVKVIEVAFIIINKR